MSVLQFLAEGAGAIILELRWSYRRDDAAALQWSRGSSERQRAWLHSRLDDDELRDRPPSLSHAVRGASNAQDSETFKDWA